MSYTAATSKKKILLLGNAHNGMSQRVQRSLLAAGHDVDVELALNQKQMRRVVAQLRPDLIICPMLTARIPEDIWSRGYPNPDVPCIIVHPGVQGDKGMSAIDWALKEDLPLGVTCLSATEEMDSGPVWATRVVSPRRADMSTLTKSSVYKNEITEAAASAVLEAVEKFVAGGRPTEVSPEDAATLGTLLPTMSDADRAISFAASDAGEVARAVAYSDGRPGTPVSIRGEAFLAFEAVADGAMQAPSSAVPGELLGHRDGAVAVACCEGSVVWLGHLQRTTKGAFKLKAISALPVSVVQELPELPPVDVFWASNAYSPAAVFKRPAETYTEIWAHVVDRVCYVMFEFYNGAMSTEQCRRLSSILAQARDRRDVDAVVLTGGYNAFSNGIHLNSIHAAEDATAGSWSSWLNINAINDVVSEVFRTTDKLTISALRGSAGAGGFMAALAADRVLAHEGVVINPHYRSMGLFGSEYWTYSLPLRVGYEKALEITESKQAMSMAEALALNLVDGVIAPNVESFQEALHSEVLQLLANCTVRDELAEKQQSSKERFQELEHCRSRELAIMFGNFESLEYCLARERFVAKKKPVATPAHLTSRRGELMDGVALAKTMQKRSALEIQDAMLTAGRPPVLGVVLVEGRSDSKLYVKKKVEAARSIGAVARVLELPARSPELVRQDIIAAVERWNVDPAVDGIMIQLPVAGIKQEEVCEHISMVKDVDCLNPNNFRHFLTTGSHTAQSVPFKPPCPFGILELLLHYQVPLKGRSATVVGTSPNLGLPTACLLSHEGCQVTQLDINSQDLARHLRSADVVVSAVGVPNLIRPDMLQDGAVVVDAGISLKERGRLCGDVDPEVRNMASMITPVPGGVGPMTVAMLMRNLTINYLQRTRDKELPYASSTGAEQLPDAASASVAQPSSSQLAGTLTRLQVESGRGSTALTSSCLQHK